MVSSIANAIHVRLKGSKGNAAPKAEGVMERGQVVAGKYRLNQLLGSGGMADVWSATNTFTERQIAIKFMSPAVAKTPEAAARFLKEAKVSARINHPNIIDIHDVGQTEEGQLFLVMELLTGYPLEVALRRQTPPMFVFEFALVMIEVAQALAAAHKSGVIHRDLKPTNIFLHKVREDVAIPKLLDFGVSKFLEEDQNHQLTMAGTVLGSPLYMSPEQARGESNLDGRTDVFAFGAILFEALCGYRAYEAKNFNALIVKIATTKPKSIDACAPHVPEGIRHVVRACMETDPKKRAASFDDVVAWLQAALPELEASGVRLPMPLIANSSVDPEATNALPVMRTRPSERPPAVSPSMNDTIPNASVILRGAVPRAVPGSVPPPGTSSSGSLPPGSVPLFPSTSPTGPSWHTPNTSYASIAAPPPKKRSAAWLAVGGVGLIVFGLAVGALATKHEPADNRTQAAGRATDTASPADPTSPNGSPSANGANANSSPNANGATLTSAANAGANAPTSPSGAASTGAPTISVEALPGAAKAPAEPRVTREGGSGRLSVTATPGWCTIAVDGKERGATPVAALELPAGSHQVTCKPASGKTRSASVTVVDGTTAKYKFALDD